MKKQLLIILASGFISSTLAQTIPNGGFENWGAALGQPVEPTGWVSGNVLAAPIATFPLPNTNPTSVFKETSIINAGTASMRIQTVKLTQNPLAANGVNDTVGFCLLGSATLAPVAGLIQGAPNTNRYASFNFWYQYIPSGIDAAGALCVLTKWNSTTNTRDTVALGSFVTSTATTGWTNVSFPLTYNPAYSTSGNPDTLRCAFASSVGTYDPNFAIRPSLGSKLYIDDASAVGVKENYNKPSVKVYPNPANNILNLSLSTDIGTKVEIYDVTGKLVLASNIDGKFTKLNIENLNDGMYIYKIIGKEKEVVTTGKVNVVK